MSTMAARRPQIALRVALSDGTATTAVRTVRLTVYAPAIIAGALSGSGAEDTEITGNLSATDAQGLTDGTIFSISTDSSNGTATIHPASGAWTYTPTANFNGTDSFTVTVTDDLGGTTTQVINVTVNPVNDAPIIVGNASQIGSDIDGIAEYDGLGASLALSADGSVVAIGAPYNAGNGDFNGQVRLYRNMGGSWSQIGSGIDGEAEYDGLGTSLALSADGSVVAIGAPKNDGNGDFNGQVRLYRNVGGSWSQIGRDIDGESLGDSSGSSVALSADGSVVAIGAPYNDGNGRDSGQVRLYRNVGGSWSQMGGASTGKQRTTGRAVRWRCRRMAPWWPLGHSVIPVATGMVGCGSIEMWAAAGAKSAATLTGNQRAMLRAAQSRCRRMAPWWPSVQPVTMSMASFVGKFDSIEMWTAAGAKSAATLTGMETETLRCRFRRMAPWWPSRHPLTLAMATTVVGCGSIEMWAAAGAKSAATLTGKHGSTGAVRWRCRRMAPWLPWGNR